MKKWIHRLAALALSTAGVSHATPVEDFARGTTLDVRRVAASLHITAPFTDERRTAMTSDEQCFSKVAGSHDIDMNLGAIGLPVTVRFTGTPIGPDRLRFTVDQDINQCVVIDGSQRRIKRISGTLNARLNMFADPRVGRCASDLAQNLQVAGGGESDTENRLHITVDSGCGGITFGGDVVVHDIVLDGLSGRFPIEPPVAVAEFSNERTFICPPPVTPMRVPGVLRLENPAPRLGAIFSLSTTDSRVALSRPVLSFPRGLASIPFSTVIPAGFIGSYQVQATGAASATTAAVNVTPGIFGGSCRIPSFVYRDMRFRLGDCLACELSGRVRHAQPAFISARSQLGALFSSAPSEAGSAGYSTLDGKLIGLMTDAAQGKTWEVPDVRFFDLSDDGVAIGTTVDPKSQTSQPVSFSASGGLKVLPTPFGWGEARVINGGGDVGGFVLDKAGVAQAAVWLGGNLLNVAPQGAQHSEVVALSEDRLATITWVDAAGTPQSATFDAKSQKLALLAPPKGYDGLELVGATSEGLRAGHLYGKQGAEPFLDYGAGVQLLAPMLEKGVQIDRLISLGADGALLAKGSFNGTAQYFLLQVK